MKLCPTATSTSILSPTTFPGLTEFSIWCSSSKRCSSSFSQQPASATAAESAGTGNLRARWRTSTKRICAIRSSQSLGGDPTRFNIRDCPRTLPCVVRTDARRATGCPTQRRGGITRLARQSGSRNSVLGVRSGVWDGARSRRRRTSHGTRVRCSTRSTSRWASIQGLSCSLTSIASLGSRRDGAGATSRTSEYLELPVLH
mmetsp:Transcript_54181/g.126552  ORF Transcript_54181/g.126552 Transcript_54181/m.126552 type:complete len:201 (-) Transcript_54181:30-632(-)